MGDPESSDRRARGDALWSAVRPDGAGLVAAVVQHAINGQVLMVGYMDEASMRATLRDGLVTFFSRSRQTQWRKGETSGNTLRVAEIRVDCDGDALLVRAHPAGPTCHTGTTSCFYRRLDADSLTEDDGPVGTSLDRTFAVILDRKAGRGTTNREGKSYVRSLLDKGAPKIGEKLREEASELADAVANESEDRVAQEAADLLFHALVGLAARDLSLDDVGRVLDRRFGTSGIDEKAARGSRQ